MSNSVALVNQFTLSRATSIYREYQEKVTQEIWKEREYAQQYLGKYLADNIVKTKLSKQQIINRIYQDLLALQHVSTPWELEPKDPIMYGFDEEDALPVVFGDEEGDIYTHYVTEELVLGILLVPITDRFMICFSESYWHFGEHAILITLDNLISKYILSQGGEKKKYTASTNYGNITFNTIDVIKGVVTAASWLNIDAHTYIKDIREDGKLVTF